MNAMNQIIIEGNVVRQPSVRETPNGKKVCMMPIAVNRVYKDSTGKDAEETGFFDVQSWGDGFTERITKYGCKGRGVRVVGRLKQDRWKDDSGSHSKIYILAEHVDFKPYKKKDESLESSMKKASEIVTETEDTMSMAQEAADVSETDQSETKTAAAEELNLQTAAAGIAQETEAVF